MVQINVRVDEDVKRRAERVCQEIGISMSSAINVYLKKIARENKIPFELTADPFYSKENMDYLEKKYKEYKERKSNLIDEDVDEWWELNLKIEKDARLLCLHPFLCVCFLNFFKSHENLKF